MTSYDFPPAAKRTAPSRRDGKEERGGKRREGKEEKKETGSSGREGETNKSRLYETICNFNLMRRSDFIWAGQLVNRSKKGGKREGRERKKEGRKDGSMDE